MPIFPGGRRQPDRRLFLDLTVGAPGSSVQVSVQVVDARGSPVAMQVPIVVAIPGAYAEYSGTDTGTAQGNEPVTGPVSILTTADGTAAFTLSAQSYGTWTATVTPCPAAPWAGVPGRCLVEMTE